jgi:hypothetical protein
MFHVDDLRIERAVVAGIEVITTAAVTKTLTKDSASVQGVTGSVAGQIIRMPNATTCLFGQKYEVLNQSSQPVRVEDAAGGLLAWVSAETRCTIWLGDISTAAGYWFITNECVGANYQISNSSGESQNTSNSTPVTKVSLTTLNLALGNYELMWNYGYRVANAGRIIVVQIMQGATVLEEHIQGVDATTDRLISSGMLAIEQLSGANTFSVRFRVATGQLATTVYLSGASLSIKRVS